MRIMWLIVLSLALSLLWKEKNIRILIAVFISIGFLFGADRYANSFGQNDSSDFFRVGEWAATHPTEKIAMLQSGIAGFVAPNVINLDGKVNAEALRAHQQGRLAEYLRDERFTYIADWKPFIEDIAEIARKDELYFDSVGMIDRVQLMRRRDLDSGR